MFDLYLNRPKAVSSALMSLAALLVFVAAPSSGQTVAISWGDAIDGIQLRLAITAAGEAPYERPGASPKPLPGDLPHLECQIWNRGTAAFPITNSIKDSQFQIDGIWYGSGPGGGGGGTLETLAVGGQSHIYALMFRTGLYELDAQMARVRSGNGNFRILDLKPGKHSVRVRAGLNVAGKQVMLTSNTIAIEIPATPAVRKGWPSGVLIMNMALAFLLMTFTSLAASTAKALAAINDDRTIPYFSRAVAESGCDVKFLSLSALARFNNDDALAALKRAALDSDERIRTEAQQYLKLRAEASNPTLGR